MTKDCLKFELEYFVKEDISDKYSVIIVAAGSASRMNGIDKISSLVNGIPVLVRSIRAFESSKHISNIIVVTKQDMVPIYTEYKELYSISKPYKVISGADSREQSVLCGIKALDCKENKVIVHDGARPLVSNKVIERVCKAMSKSDSVACAVKLKDTVKVINEDNQVIKTLKRDSLVSIQTPQGVNVEMFSAAADKYNLADFTDDASVVEAEGAKTIIVEGDYRNIKITTPDDLLLADVFAKDLEDE